MIDTETQKWLTLLHGSPDFVVQIDPATESGKVLKLDQVPADAGHFWVYGQSTLKCGVRLNSVFVTDTDSGGELVRAFWKTENGWVDSQDIRIERMMGRSRKDIFPFEWSYAVPLERDIFHVGAKTTPWWKFWGRS